MANKGYKPMKKTKPNNFNRVEGKYLAVPVGNKIYGIGFLEKDGEHGFMIFSTVPSKPDYIRGTITINGKDISVIDKMLKSTPQSEESVIPASMCWRLPSESACIN